MNKRLSRTDYLFTLVIIFMLVCIAAAFFYGVKVGNQKAETKYQAILKKDEPVALAAYDQQYLVSFYHTIYMPYRDFQKKWFEHMEEIELHSNRVDPSSLMKQLSHLAAEKYEDTLNMTMPDTSPLLKDAHQNYLKSLKLFSETLKKYQSTANSMHGTVLIEEIEKDAFFQEAKNFALKAQADYYSAIVKWNESVNPNLTGLELLNKPNLNQKEWSQLNINLKNSYIATIMANSRTYQLYMPHDLTVRIEELISSGQAKKMNLNEIDKMAETLVGTRAVRHGDFISGKDKWYGTESLPQLPFFFEQ